MRAGSYCSPETAGLELTSQKEPTLEGYCNGLILSPKHSAAWLRPVTHRWCVPYRSAERQTAVSTNAGSGHLWRSWLDRTWMSLPPHREVRHVHHADGSSLAQRPLTTTTPRSPSCSASTGSG